MKTRFQNDDSYMLNDIALSPDIVLYKLTKLKLNKAPGLNGIVPRLLVENADVLCRPLSIIFRCSISTACVPLDWKRAKVSVIFKKWAKNLPSNFRPISVTSHVCKVLKSIIIDNIVEHLGKYDLINDSQHGFVRKRSCLTHLLEFLEFVSEYVHKGYP